MTDQEILDYPFTFEEEKTTLRQLFRDLLLKLWEETDGFNGKRPFGNSGWYLDMIEPLILTGAISGTIDRDEDGYIQDQNFEWDEASPVMERLIKTALATP